MRRKRIQEFANNLCPMFAGWRINEDLEILANLPDGKLDIDLLGGKAQHSSSGPLDLHISKELECWLKEQLKSANISLSTIKSAALSVQFRTDRVATDRNRIILFEFVIESSIATDEMTYSDTLKEACRWHKRVGT